jgi:thiopurine S-methyltransferase
MAKLVLYDGVCGLCWQGTSFADIVLASDVRGGTTSPHGWRPGRGIDRRRPMWQGAAMDAAFWLGRWIDGWTAFHQADANRHLVAFWPELGVAPARAVFVPLCGKSLDMLWLRDHLGHEVVGVELSPLAVQAFDAENALGMRRSAAGPLERFEADRLLIYQGDYFDLCPTHVGNSGGFYDRASLIALPHGLRPRYAEQLRRLLPPDAAGLLIAIEYPEHEMDGPPFSVREAEVRALFGTGFDVRVACAADEPVPPHLANRGMTAFREVAYLLRPHLAM